MVNAAVPRRGRKAPGRAVRVGSPASLQVLALWRSRLVTSNGGGREHRYLMRLLRSAQRRIRVRITECLTKNQGVAVGHDL